MVYFSEAGGMLYNMCAMCIRQTNNISQDTHIIYIHRVLCKYLCVAGGKTFDARNSSVITLWPYI